MVAAGHAAPHHAPRGVFWGPGWPRRQSPPHLTLCSLRTYAGELQRQGAVGSGETSVWFVKKVGRWGLLPRIQPEGPALAGGGSSREPWSPELTLIHPDSLLLSLSHQELQGPEGAVLRARQEEAEVPTAGAHGLHVGSQRSDPLRPEPLSGLRPILSPLGVSPPAVGLLKALGTEPSPQDATT